MTSKPDVLKSDEAKPSSAELDETELGEAELGEDDLEAMFSKVLAACAAKGQDGAKKARDPEEPSSVADLFAACSECRSSRMIFDHLHHCFVCEDCVATTDKILDESADAAYQDGGVGHCQTRTYMYGGRYNKMLAMHNWGNMLYKDRCIIDMCNNIESMCRKAHVPKPVVDNAKILYRKIRECKYADGPHRGKSIIYRGNKLKQLVAACLLFGSVLEKNTLAVDKVADILGVRINDVTRGCRRFVKTIDDKSTTLFKVDNVKALEYVHRIFRKNASVRPELSDMACVVTENMYKLNIATNHHPTTVAAVAVVLAHGALSPAEMAAKDMAALKKCLLEFFEISSVTLNQIIKEVKPYQRVLCSNTLTEHVLRSKDEIMARKTTSDDNVVILETDDVANGAKRPRGRPKTTAVASETE